MVSKSSMSLLSDDRAVIQELLGREPRGLEAVAYRDKCGVPMVIRVAPLVDNKPFPTLFWLIDKRLNYAIDQVEASGLIAELQQQVDDNAGLQQQLQVDHMQHIEDRQRYMSDAVKQKVETLGYSEVYTRRGIGGIADFRRIRCLHTFYAAHLVRPNTVGRLLDEYWHSNGQFFNHFDLSDSFSAP